MLLDGKSGKSFGRERKRQPCCNESGIICVRYYDGETYNWSEENGGAGLGTELSLDMVRLMQDFRHIDTAWLLQHPAGSWIRKFDLPAWLRRFRNNRARGFELGFSEEEIQRAEEIIGAGFELNDQIFGNGDFYPRNLVKLPQNTVVIDWEYRQGFRACFLDYVPNVLGFAFVHMFNNDPWRAEFIRYSRDTFRVSTDDLRRAIEQGSLLVRVQAPVCFLIRRSSLGWL
jgi:hypothetical protein